MSILQVDKSRDCHLRGLSALQNDVILRNFELYGLPENPHSLNFPLVELVSHAQERVRDGWWWDACWVQGFHISPFVQREFILFSVDLLVKQNTENKHGQVKTNYVAYLGWHFEEGALFLKLLSFLTSNELQYSFRFDLTIQA